MTAVVHFAEENNIERRSITKEVLNLIMVPWLEMLQQQTVVGLFQPLRALHFGNGSDLLVVF